MTQNMYYKVMSFDASGLAKKCVYQEPPYITWPAVPPLKSTLPRIANSRPTYQVQNSFAIFPNNFPIRNKDIIRQDGSMQCFGCSGKDHMLGECPQMQELIRNGIITQDPCTQKYFMANSWSIYQQAGESISNAVQQIQTLTYRQPLNLSSNLVTLGLDVYDYY